MITQQLNPRFNEGVFKRRNRRRMAWVSLVAILVITLMLMFCVSPERIESLKGIIEMVYLCLSSIVLGYLGIATYDDNNIMKAHPATKVNNAKEEPVDDEEELIKKGSSSK